MPFKRGAFFPFLFLIAFSAAAAAIAVPAPAAQNGTAGDVRGAVTDPSGAVIPGATVTLANAVSGFSRTETSDATGQFVFSNVPSHTYRISVTAPGFAPLAQPVDARSMLGASLKLVLQIAAAGTTVTVEAGGDLVENDSTFHTDVERDEFTKLPLESESSGISSLVTLSTPGISADSDGQMHGLGDHAENSFSVDGQSITDQQSKVFSNQVPLDSVQSLEVISGAPPAEFGDKTSVVVKVTTRSGLDTPRPTGNINVSYGSFGTMNAGFNFAAGSKNVGEFIAANFLNTGRFLDPPEFQAFHDKGNEENVFNRADYRFNSNDSVQLNLGYTRSWFQTPNSYDNQDPAMFNPNFAPGALPATDQRSKIGTFNVAPTWTHVVNNESVLNTGAFIRKDQFDYYPSSNPLSDLGPANLQRETVSQTRSLTNYGVHSDISWNRGVNNVKAGVSYAQTLLRESDGLGIVDPTLNAPCVDANGSPVVSLQLTSPGQCTGQAYTPNPAYLPDLAPYDFSHPVSGTGLYYFLGHTDVKELSLYIQDAITAGNWMFNVGMRGDLYNGLTIARQAEPRVGLSYRVKPTATVLRLSYARTLETPFNENLVLSSEGCNSGVIQGLVPCEMASLPPGYRNEFHAGVEQAFGRHFVAGGEYIWKYTHNAFDFSVLGNTPITFPIDWHNSKIPGFAANFKVPNFRGFTADVVMSSVAARFFSPQVGGLGTVPTTAPGQAFRIDHDERFNQTSHLQYAVARRGHWNGAWAGWNWRYDSGQVAGEMPFAVDSTTPVDLSVLTFDQQAQSGIMCNGVRATRTAGFQSCAPSAYSSALISLPAPGAENDDRNPPRMRQRNLFDVSLGQDNIFHKERYKVNVDLTAVNITNEYSLYNFLSTFSGTHFVTPRAMTAKVTLTF